MTASAPPPRVADAGPYASTSDHRPNAPAAVVSSASRFLVVGALNTALAYVLFRVFLHGFGDRPAAAGAAQAAAYAVGIGLSYTANRRWTFRSADASHRRALPRFLAAQFGALALSTVLTQLGVSAVGLRPSVAWVLVTGFITVVNFLTQRYWVFAEPR